MKYLALTISLFFLIGNCWSQPPDKKSGTIEIGKDKSFLSGLYQKTNIVYGKSIEDVESILRNDSKSGAVKSEM
ncbi:MAG: hypothetical protein JKY54_12120, partial [Flavobacteriales bacterium]|nr:hypothetical protein [Flavobacteriales bacterium]